MGFAFQKLALQSATAARANGAACSFGLFSFFQFLCGYLGSVELDALALPELDGSVDR